MFVKVRTGNEEPLRERCGREVLPDETGRMVFVAIVTVSGKGGVVIQAEARSLLAITPGAQCLGETKQTDQDPLGFTMTARYQDIITIEPGTRGGRPTIRGTRITVGDVLGWLAAGMTPQEIVADFPELTEADIRAALAFAADGERRAFGAAE